MDQDHRPDLTLPDPAPPTPVTTATISTAVADAARWLDQHERGWNTLIDLRTFQIGSSQHCVCDQAGLWNQCVDYPEMVRAALLLTAVAEDTPDWWPRRPEVQAAWVAEVTRRQETRRA